VGANEKKPSVAGQPGSLIGADQAISSLTSVYRADQTDVPSSHWNAQRRPTLRARPAPAHSDGVREKRDARIFRQCVNRHGVQIVDHRPWAGERGTPCKIRADLFCKTLPGVCERTVKEERLDFKAPGHAQPRQDPPRHPDRSREMIRRQKIRVTRPMPV
jgi:hypothetical protein